MKRQRWTPAFRCNRQGPPPAYAARQNAERHFRQNPPGAAEGVSNPEGARAETRTPAAAQNNMNRRERAVIGGDESLFRFADDTRERGGCTCSPDCVVQGVWPGSGS
jgi:hypothetical protein